MSGKFTEQQLVENIKKVFVEQDKYLFDKHVPEFVWGGKFVGDYFNQIAVDPNAEGYPIFYHTFSPFDVISNKAPHRCVVFQNGELLLDIDFDEYVAMRTAAMSVVVMKALGMKSISNKKVLIIGAGRIARNAIRFLKLNYPELIEIDCLSRSNNLVAINDVAREIGISLQTGDKNNLNLYDVIICHTQTSEPLINSIKDIKKGAFIASFISSTEHGEVHDDLYNEDSNIICDWRQTLESAKEIKRAISNDNIDEGSIILVKELLSGERKIKKEKLYTIYRSTGTPIQNLAVLQLLT